MNAKVELEKGHTSEIYSDLELYGSLAISYTLLQPNLKHLKLETGGVVGYSSVVGRHYVLGGPLAPLDHQEQAIDEVVQKLNAPSFLQTSEAQARLLKERHKYRVATCGHEMELALDNYSIMGSTTKRNLRAFCRKGAEIAQVVELDQQALSKKGVTQQHLRDFSKRWLSTRIRKEEVQFLVRPAVYSDEPHVRKFYSFDKKGQLLGFVFFNPMFEGGEVTGYCADVIRAADTAPKGHAAFIIVEALQVFQKEGRTLLSLGLSPFAPCESSLSSNDRVMSTILKGLYRHGDKLYNFRGISRNKKQFDGQPRPVFVCARKNSLLEFICMSRCVGLI